MPVGLDSRLHHIRVEVRFAQAEMKKLIDHNCVTILELHALCIFERFLALELFVDGCEDVGLGQTGPSQDLCKLQELGRLILIKFFAKPFDEHVDALEKLSLGEGSDPEEV